MIVDYIISHWLSRHSVSFPPPQLSDLTMWKERETKKKGGTMMMTIIFYLLACLHLSSQQDLAAGSNCEGERRNMCDVNSTCQLEYYSKTHYCRRKLGQPCLYRHPSAFSWRFPDYACEEGTFCFSTNLCLLKFGSDCTNRTNMCAPGYYCDAVNKCSLKAKGTCRRWTGGHCGVGTKCVDRKCRCLMDYFKYRNGQCVSRKGRTGSKCRKDKHCTDPLGTCNTATGRCVCVDGAVPHPKHLTCKLDMGSECNATSDCHPDTFCDPVLNTCRLPAGRSCEGDRAAFCRAGSYCIDNFCRYKIGASCVDRHFSSRTNCEPPSYCRGGKCVLSDNANCSQHHNGCMGVCDPNLLLCKRNVTQYCWRNSLCVPGSLCSASKCSCHPSQVVNSTTGLCSLPPGKVGGTCQQGNQCNDSNAECNNGMCRCKRGYDPDINLLTCNLKGPTCSLGGDGIINTYFKQQLQVGLPCRIKLAKIQCDDAKVAVFADNGLDSRTHSIYLSAVKIKILATNSQGNSTSTQYRIVDDDIKQKPKQNTWKTEAYASDDDFVTLRSNGKAGGNSTLTRKLLTITYIHPHFGRRRILDERRGHVMIRCSSDNFRSLNAFPKALCGRPEDAGQDVLGTYRRRVELQLKRELPNTFGYVPRGAFSTVRLTDRSVLLEQINVTQINSQCQAAMNVVQSDAGCAILQDKLFNCSHVYDANPIDKLPIYERRRDRVTPTYAACLNVTDPMTLFASCMRLQCTGQGRTETCSSLRAAFTRCTSSVQTRLLRMFNCPLVVP